MSRFQKLVLTVLGATLALYLLTCSSFSMFETKQELKNTDELVTYISTELDYEMTYGDKNIDMELFIDTALQQALKNNNK